jgi:hypothetical protein
LFVGRIVCLKIEFVGLRWYKGSKAHTNGGWCRLIPKSIGFQVVDTPAIEIEKVIFLILNIYK